MAFLFLNYETLFFPIQHFFVQECNFVVVKLPSVWVEKQPGPRFHFRFQISGCSHSNKHMALIA